MRYGEEALYGRFSFFRKKMGITDIIAVTRRGRGCYICYVVAISV